MFVSCSVCQCLRLSPWPASKHCMNVSNRKLTLALRHTISYGCSELVTSWIKWLKSAGKIQLGEEWEEYSKKMVKGQNKGSRSEARANGRGWDGGRELIGESGMGEVKERRGYRCCKHPVELCLCQLQVAGQQSNNKRTMFIHCLGWRCLAQW